MAIFNSLGSNYDRSFMWRALFTRSSKTAQTRLEQSLAERFSGKPTLLYKGRQALLLALKKSNLPADSPVVINGFTCYVVYEAVERAGHQAVLVDITPGSLHFDVSALKALNLAPAVLIVQNTFGYPCDIVGIEKYCNDNKVLLIEDLAHGSGLTYADGRAAGTVGDFVVLSFSQDKSPDVVAGGALIDRRAGSHDNVTLPEPRGYWQNRIYPILTGLIRNTFDIGFGKIVRRLGRRFKLLANPLWSSRQELASMAPASLALLPKRWAELPGELAHRRAIAEVYQADLPPTCLIGALPAGATPLRFPIVVEKPAELRNYLARYKIYLADTWYDAPLSPRWYMEKTTYQAGDCPCAEKAVGHIINLPTHRHVSSEQAKFIAQKVNAWLTSK